MGFLDELFKGGPSRQESTDFVKRFETGHPSEGYTDDEVLARYGQVAHQVTPEEYERAATEAFSRLSPKERDEFTRYLQQQAQAKMNQAPQRPTSGGGLGGALGGVLGGGGGGGALGSILGAAKGGGAGGTIGDILGGMMGGQNRSSGGGIGDILGSVLGGRSAPAAPTGGLDPSVLGKVATELHKHPGLLRTILGGGAPAAAPAPQAAPQKSIFGSPLAKAAMAGIAAVLVKNMLTRK